MQQLSDPKAADAKATARAKAEKPDDRVASVVKEDVVVRANAVDDLAKAADVVDDPAKAADVVDDPAKVDDRAKADVAALAVAEVDSALARLRFRWPSTPTKTA